MLGLMVAFESVIVRHEIRFTGSTLPLSWRIGGRSARTVCLGAEVLCFGDSLVKHGVLPRVLEGDLGRPAYNLALPGAQAPASYFLLRRALEAGVTPKALIVDFHSVTLTASLRPNLEVWPELLDWRDLLDLAWYSRDGHFLAATATARLWPSVRNRRGIRCAVVAALGGGAPDHGRVLDAYVRNGQVNRGAIVGAPVPMPQGQAEDLRRWGLWTTRWRPQATNVLYIRKFLDLAASQRLAVFWLIPPVSPAWQAECERLGHDVRYTQFVRTIVASYPNLVVVDGRRAGYERPVFVDPTHLNALGAAALSGAVAKIMHTRLVDQRPSRCWATLPAFRHRPDAVPLVEDLARSEIALATERGHSRRR
jgi:hypothetical protein